MSQFKDQKVKSINVCKLMHDLDDQIQFNEAIYNSYQLKLLLLLLLVQYGYHFGLLGRKHMSYLVELFQKYYDCNKSLNYSNNTIIIQIEEALQYNVHEHHDQPDDKYLDVFISQKYSREDIIQQIINNTQFQSLQGKDSVHVCILEQLLKLSEICSYKLQFITIVEIIQKHFKLSNYQDLYIKACTQLTLLKFDITSQYIDDLHKFQQFNIKFFALLGTFFNIFFGRKQSLIGNHYLAIETLSTVLVHDRKNYDNYYHFGIALYNNEQYEEALAAFEISQKLNYDIRQMLFIGSCYLKLKCDILAISWINRVLDLSPKNKDALFLKCKIQKYKEYILSNDFGCNLKQILEIRYKIYTIDVIYITRSNNCQKLLQSQLNEYNQILNINMAILISKYCPIEFTEPQEFVNQIEQEKFSQYMKTIKIQKHQNLQKSHQNNDNNYYDILI